MPLKFLRQPARALLTLAASSWAGTSLAQSETPIARVAWDAELRVVSDVRSRGVSDSLLRPGAKFTVQAAHESGLIGLVELTSVSRKQFLEGKGLGLVAAVGYRWGDPEAWHFGLGAAIERFPGAQFDAPHRFDPSTFTPDDFRRGTYNSDFVLLEAGYGALEARVLSVVSRSYRGATTGGVCGQILLISADPTAGIECYARGDKDSRGTLLADLNYRVELDARTAVHLHLGHQRVKNFKEANTTDYSAGVSHRRWGFTFGIDWVGVNTRVREVYLVPDGSAVRATDDSRFVLSVARKL